MLTHQQPQRTVTYQPGLLQAHGALFVLGRAARVEGVTENAAQALGIDLEASAGASAADLFEATDAAVWRLEPRDPLHVELVVRSTGRPCWGTILRTGDQKTLLEVEPAVPLPQAERCWVACQAVGEISDATAIARWLQRELARLGALPRVAMESDAGWVRAPLVVSDLTAPATRLVGTDGVLDEELDLSRARLRMPSLALAAELQRRGASAAAVVPLGPATGVLVATGPALTGAARRQVELLVRAAARRLDQLAEQEELLQALSLRSSYLHLVEAAARERSLERTLAGALFSLQRMIPNDGFALWTPRTCCTVGDVPRAEILGELLAQLGSERRVQEGTSAASEDAAPSSHFLAVPLPERGWLAFFRRPTEDGAAVWSRAQRRIARELSEDVLPTVGRVAATAALGRSDTGALLSELSRERERRERERRHLLEFVSVASHDLRAPMRNLGSLVQWLREDHADELGPDARQLVQLLEERVRRAGQLVEGVLAYSRLGVEDVALEEVDLTELVADVLDVLEVPPHVRVEVEPSLPTVRYRSLQLRQLLQNLLDNAFKYNDQADGRVWVRCLDRGDVWELQIEDNGPGVPPADREQIFAIFRRGGATSAEGTGVGLAIVRRIAEAHGGSVWVEATPRGSCFSVTVPKEPEE